MILLGAALLRAISPDQAEERLIIPDGLEYAVSSVNFVRGMGYVLVINGASYPPRYYPFGYPLCLAPFYFFLGEKLGNGVFCTFSFSMGTLLLLFFLTRKLFGEKVALWATFFLALSPLHIYWSRVIMADVPSCFMALAAVGVLLGKEIKPKRLFGVGMLIGVAAWLKYLNLLFFPICALFLLLRRGKVKEKLSSLISFASGMIVSLIPLLLYNQRTFGSPFRTGFSFWTPEWVRWENIFSTRHAFQSPPLPAHAPLPSLLVFGQFLLGIVFPRDWNPYSFFLTPFIGVGVWKILREAGSQKKRNREFLLFTFLATGFLYIFFSFYYAQNVRYFMPVVPLLLIVAAVGFDHLFSRWPVTLQRSILLLSGAMLIASPFVLWKISGTSSARRSYVDLIRNNTEKNASVITGWDPVSFSHEIQEGTKRRYMPLSKKLEYVHEPFHPDPKRKISFFVAPQELESIEKLIASKHPIYIDERSCQNYSLECALLKEKFSFKEIASRNGVQLYRLEKR
ncbi:MAG: glycosyltransferase family 39 protein [Candidatus Omnitrophica bacterium]|nr:glycosyltransferase family 39 protein [Candidatus Omnitrophota bacterium]